MVLLIAGLAQTLWQRKAMLTALLADQERLVSLRQSAGPSIHLQPAPGVADLKADVAVRSIGLELNVPWLQLMDSAQAAAGNTITLNKMLPDAATARMQIEGQAPSMDEFLGYLKRLQHNDHFQQVVPMNVEPLGGGGVRFQVSTGWKVMP